MHTESPLTANKKIDINYMTMTIACDTFWLYFRHDLAFYEHNGLYLNGRYKISIMGIVIVFLPTILQVMQALCNANLARHE
jgi:hypothetical protein